MALAGDVANLIVALRLDDKGFTGKLNAASKQLSQMDRGLSQMGKGAGQLAGGLGKIATLGAVAAVGGLTAVITTAASFEQAFTGVEKTVEGTDAQLAELEETLREMARTIPVSFEELAGIGEAGGALGIARESLDEFVDVVARLAVSTDLTAETAATALGQLGNVLHLSGQDFEDFADTLVALGNAGASTESQIVEIAARFGAAGNAAGLSKEEILALSSAVASMGIEVEAGGSSLSRLFNQTTTNIGVGSKKAEAFAEALGLTFDEFKKAWDKDALGTFEDLLNHLNDLDKFQAAALLKKIGITGVRDINAIGLMAQNVGFVADQLEIAQSAQGALGEESGKFFATTQGQWKILQNNVRDAAAVIGTELLPVVNEVIGDFVKFLAEPGSQQGLKDFAKDLAGGVRGLVTEIRNADFGPLMDTFKAAAGIAKAGFDAFRALPSGVQALVLAAVGVNKITGGALSDIAGGLGNILGGALKLAIPALSRGITPANPMFVKEVGLGGGLGGKGGGGGVGGKGGFPFIPLLGAVGVAALELAIADWLAQNVTRPANPTGFDFNTIAGQSGQFGSQIQVEQFIAALSTEVGIPIDEAKADIVAAVNTEGLTFDQAVAALRAELIPLGQFNPANKGGTRAPLGTGTSSAAAPWSAEHKAAFAKLNTEVANLPDTAMLAPAVTALTTNLPQLAPILGRVNSKLAQVDAKAQRQVSLLGEDLAATRGQTGLLTAIRNKRSSVNVNVDTTIYSTVHVAASQVAQQVASYSRTRSAGPTLE